MAIPNNIIRRSSLMSVAMVIVSVFASETVAKDLNPQPEPPGTFKMLIAPHSGFQLNPQPEPPGSIKKHVGSSLKLNPQPEPPGLFRTFRPRDWQGLNPQPEPP
jgi:hypothetical protein